MKEVIKRIKKADEPTRDIVANDKTIRLLKAGGLNSLYIRLNKSDGTITQYLNDIRDTDAYYTQVVPLALRYRIVDLIISD